MEFKKLLKNHILLILKDNNTDKYVLKRLMISIYNLFLYNCIYLFFRYNSPLLPNVIEQAVKDSNEYLASKSRPPLSLDIVNLIETQVLSIKEPDHKIRTLVGNIIVISINIVFYYYSMLISSGQLRILNINCLYHTYCFN